MNWYSLDSSHNSNESELELKQYIVISSQTETIDCMRFQLDVPMYEIVHWFC